MEVLTKVLQKQFDKMCSTGRLFRVNVEGELIWTAYMYGFGEDPIYRDPNSSVHNCNYCHGFIRRYGNLVAIDPKTYQVISLFDIDPSEIPDEYKKSIADMAKEIHSEKAEVKEIFVETYRYLSDPKTPYDPDCKDNQDSYQVGVKRNIKRYTKEEAARYPNAGIKPNQTAVFNHFFLTVPREFINFSGQSREELMSTPRQAKEVFKRGLDEISTDTMNLILDLEAQGSLLNGASYKHVIQKALNYAEEYKNIPSDLKNNYAWLKSLEWGPSCGFRNTAIGQLMIDLSEGKEINAACESFNRIVDPANYKKAKAPITQRQIEEARKFVEENGYEESFERRCAIITDINVQEILHTNADASDAKTKISLFDGVKSTAPTRHKKSEFDKVEEVPVEKFMAEILPRCSSVEVFLTGKHKGNFMTLLTSCNKDSKRIFKWDNNFSWTYTGNLAGKSQLKDAVIQAGGRVGVIRFSHSWNELERNESLMDAHVFMPGDHYGNANASLDRDGVHNFYPQGQRVGWNQRKDTLSGGVQDVDYTSQAPVGYVPVENITFPDISKMPEGKYYYKIHNWNFRRTSGKGKAEIEFDGQIYQYIYPALKHHEWCTVAIVTLKDGKFSIEHKLPLVDFEDKEEGEIFGLDTGKFHKVSLICLSPNFWDGQGVGNKHYFFCLRGAKSPEKIRSIHNEFLRDDLMRHRKVMEVLGQSLLVESTEGQLSGLGFNSTVRDELIVKLGGSFKRVIKIKF